LTEIFLDVLNFPRAGFERVLLDHVLHGESIIREASATQYSMPMARPWSSTSSLCACGTLPRPGISIIAPAMATTNPAPAERVTSLIVSVQPAAAPTIA